MGYKLSIFGENGGLIMIFWVNKKSKSTLREGGGKTIIFTGSVPIAKYI